MFSFNDYSYFFTVSGQLAEGTYEFDTTLNDAASTVLTTAVVYPGDLQLPYIDSSTQTAAWDGDNLVLSWNAPTGANVAEIDQLRAIIYAGDFDLYVKLPADATTVSIPANVLEPLGLTPTYNFYNAKWQMQTRAEADGKNYARGISNTVALPGVPPTAFTEENLAGKTLYVVWYGLGDDAQGNQIDNVAVAAKEVFNADGTVDVIGLLNHNDYSGVSYGVTNAGMLYYDGVTTEGNTIICNTANNIKTDYTENGAFDNVDVFFFEQRLAKRFADGLDTLIPQGCL